MEIKISTSSASALKTALIKGADDGTLKTWRVVKSKENGELLTHSPEQWNEKVLLILTPIENDNLLIVTTSYWRGHSVPTDDDRSYYFGRFIEALLANYRHMFSEINITV